MSRLDWTIPLLLIATTSVAVGGSRQDPAIEDFEGAVHSLMSQTLVDTGAEALSVVVAIGDEPLFEGGLGPARPGKTTSASAETRFGGAPLAHALLVTATLQVEAEGHISHEDRIAAHLPELVAEGSPVRVIDLLAHTSGLPDYRDHAPAELLSKGRPSFVQVSESVRELALETKPGECVKASATDTLLLAALLEKVTGKAAEQVLASSIFEPLGMNDTGYDLSPGLAMASEASSKDGSASAFLPRGLYSTALDLLRFQRGLVDLTLLGSDELEAMNVDVHLTDGTHAGSGLGVRHVLLHESSGLLLGETVVQGGAQLAYYPDFDLSIAVLARGEGFSADRLARSIARLVIVEPEPGVRDIPLTEEGMKPYLGTYQIGCTTVVIRGTAGYLVLDEVDESPTVLLNQGEHLFMARDDPEVRLTFTVEDELASSFVLDKHGVRSVAVRFRKDR